MASKKLHAAVLVPAVAGVMSLAAMQAHHTDTGVGATTNYICAGAQAQGTVTLAKDEICEPYSGPVLCQTIPAGGPAELVTLYACTPD